MNTEKVFLTADWRKLIFAQYEVEEAVLQKYLPKNVELDPWQGKCYVSLVGFLFTDVRLGGFKIPFHHHFEEVNLRFYVKYKDGAIWKRGVVFISEVVPKAAITLIANTIYGEKYSTAKMSYQLRELGDHIDIGFSWKKKRWNNFSVSASNFAKPMVAGGESEFITEHYWGYTKINDQTTSEYGVQHPRWDEYKVLNYNIDVDFGQNYGPDFKDLTNQTPYSVIFAEGSPIRIMGGRKF
ncbi:uncharacterized protein YqjF (DUF2071 family) [Pedobacter sp. UYP30]|uniref:YqjF family protein n=1 Tax=Pedobacter sp. UYP30 TaxID=1756400 RepID=UPI0033922C53